MGWPHPSRSGWPNKRRFSDDFPKTTNQQTENAFCSGWICKIWWFTLWRQLNIWGCVSSLMMAWQNEMIMPRKESAIWWQTIFIREQRTRCRFSKDFHLQRELAKLNIANLIMANLNIVNLNMVAENIHLNRKCWFSNISKYIRRYSKIFKDIQIYSKKFKDIQRCSKISKDIQRFSKIRKYIHIYSKKPRYVQRYSKIFKDIQRYPNIIKDIHLYRELSVGFHANFRQQSWLLTNTKVCSSGKSPQDHYYIIVFEQSFFRAAMFGKLPMGFQWFLALVTIGFNGFKRFPMAGNHW